MAKTNDNGGRFHLFRQVMQYEWFPTRPQESPVYIAISNSSDAVREIDAENSIRAHMNQDGLIYKAARCCARFHPWYSSHLDSCYSFSNEAKPVCDDKCHHPMTVSDCSKQA